MLRRLCGLALVLLVAVGCGGGPGVLESTGPAARRELVAPQYVAVVPGGLVVRRGETTRRIADGTDSVWLDDGRLIYNQAYAAHGFTDNMRGYLLDPSTGRKRLLDPDGAQVPDQALWGILIGGRSGELVLHSPDLSRTTRLRLPPYDDRSGSRGRSVGDGAVMHGATYLSWSITDDDEEKTVDYGYYLVRGGRVTTVLHRQRIIALWVSSDGRSLLGLQQVKGDPCGGCVVPQQVVELDPSKGTIARTYGVPDGYDKTWRVTRIDKVGAQVAVQYERRAPSAYSREIGTFRLTDDGWSKVRGSDRVLTTWQGHDDRIEARLTGATVAHARLSWVHGGRRTRLPGDLTRSGNLGHPSIPGGLLRPAG